MVKAFEFNVHHLSPVRLRKASKHGWAKKVKMSLLTFTMNLFKYIKHTKHVPSDIGAIWNITKWMNTNLFIKFRINHYLKINPSNDMRIMLRHYQSMMNLYEIFVFTDTVLRKTFFSNRREVSFMFKSTSPAKKIAH